MLIKYKCYNIDKKPYIKDITKHYDGKKVVSGTKNYILTSDKKLRQSKKLEGLPRGNLKGWSLSDAYIVITYCYKYNTNTKTIYISLNIYRPLVCVFDTVYYIQDANVLTKDEVNKLRVFGLDSIRKLTTKTIERVIYDG